MDRISLSDPKSNNVWPTPSDAAVVAALKAGGRALRLQPDHPLDAFPLTYQLLSNIHALLSRQVAGLPWLLADESMQLGESVARIGYLARSVSELAANMKRTEGRLVAMEKDTGNGWDLGFISGLGPFLGPPSAPARAGGQ